MVRLLDSLEGQTRTVRRSLSTSAVRVLSSAAAILRYHSTQVGVRQSLDDAADLRFARSGAEYRAEVVSTDTVNDALSILDELLAGLEPVMEDRLSAT